jgi:8-amino-7-oxononanoate synthase
VAPFDRIPAELQQREQQGLYRRRRVIQSPQGRELVVDGRKLLNFCSNDYLGLASDARVRQAFVAGVGAWGVGSGASHLICGHSQVHHELETALAEFCGRERSLLFATGYAANMGTVDALLGRGDQVFEDRLNHASLLDGARLSGARLQRYRHRDLDDLEARLRRHNGDTARRLVVTDGTFSMDGTVCDITATAATARAHGAWLMLDEAHSLGVLGHGGRGLLADAADAQADVQVLVGTLGKAFGTQGGFVAGTAELVELLIQTARTYIYSTALPAAVAAATLMSLQLAEREEWRREKLRELTQQFRAGARRLGLDLVDSHTPIQPLLLGSEQAALQLSARLESAGFMISAIRPPTVPAGTSRLRITLTANHTPSDVAALLQALDEARA